MLMNLSWITSSYSPSSTPLMYLFEAPFFFIGLLLIGKNWSKNNKNGNFSLLVILLLAGFVAPSITIVVPAKYDEPMEAVFSLPFLLMLCSYSFDRGITLAGISTNRSYLISNTFDRYILAFKKRLLRPLMAISIVLIFLSAGLFLNSVYFHYERFAADNQNQGYYPFYGWSRVTNYIVSHHLYSLPIYYVSASEGYMQLNISQMLQIHS